MRKRTITKRLDPEFYEAIEKVKKELAEQGLGDITDAQASKYIIRKLKKKRVKII